MARSIAAPHRPTEHYGRAMDDTTSAAIDRMKASPLFPFDGDLNLKTLGPPMDAELPRNGEGDKPCGSCGNDERTWWSNERWKITTVQRSINPVGLFLETVDHIDFEDFDENYASEFGVLTMHLEAAIRSLESVGRVHIHRWGDGSSHFHVWFQGRPAKQLELYGWGNVLWAQVAEPLPQEVVDANHEVIVADLSRRYGGVVADR